MNKPTRESLVRKFDRGCRRVKQGTYGVLFALAVFSVVVHATPRVAAYHTKDDTFMQMYADVTLENGLTLVAKERKESSTRGGYKIEVRYPYIQEARSAVAKHFNQEINALFSKEIERFKKDAKEFRNDPAFKETPPFTFDIDYSLLMAAHGLISILLEGASWEGGGTSIPYSSVLSYDFTKGRVLSLGELFKPNSNYLKVISKYCIDSLKQRPLVSHEHIEDGAAEKIENYSMWNITPRGLLITFPPYQVASKAEGAQQVLIAFRILKNILKPSSYIKTDE